jgi:hypothetical protein
MKGLPAKTARQTDICVENKKFKSLLNFCFRGYFSGARRSGAGYVTKYAGKRDRKEAQRKLNIKLKIGKFKRL